MQDKRIVRAKREQKEERGSEYNRNTGEESRQIDHYNTEFMSYSSDDQTS